MELPTVKDEKSNWQIVLPAIYLFQGIRVSCSVLITEILITYVMGIVVR